MHYSALTNYVIRLIITIRKSETQNIMEVINMKTTMNKVQRAYMVAKARVHEIESQQEEIEKKYIADHGITNPDGSTPE